MSLTYNYILRQSALAVNALTGTTAVQLQSSYSTTPLTSANFKSADFPLSNFLDRIRVVEGRLAQAIAQVPDFEWRSYLKAQTSNVADNAELPTVSSANDPIIGVLGAIRDSSNQTEFREKPLYRVLARIRSASAFVSPVYYYAIDGNRLRHTRTNVVIDVCVYNAATAVTRIATLTNNIILPDVLEDAYVSGVVSMMVRDDAFEKQAALYRGYYMDVLQNISQGGTQIAPMAA
jgi:hypothetical protein